MIQNKDETWGRCNMVFNGKSKNPWREIKYWFKIIFLALADISMCECYNNRNDKLENYCRIK